MGSGTKMTAHGERERKETTREAKTKVSTLTGTKTTGKTIMKTRKGLLQRSGGIAVEETAVEAKPLRPPMLMMTGRKKTDRQCARLVEMPLEEGVTQMPVSVVAGRGRPHASGAPSDDLISR